VRVTAEHFLATVLGRESVRCGSQLVQLS
jgi:hypothetical protein